MADPNSYLRRYYLAPTCFESYTKNETFLRQKTIQSRAFCQDMEQLILKRPVDKIQWDQWFNDYIQERFPIGNSEVRPFIEYVVHVVQKGGDAKSSVEYQPWWHKRSEGQKALPFPEVMSYDLKR